MCGILYARSKSKTNTLMPVNKLILKQYKNQRNRGIEGFGLYDFDYKHIIHEPKEKKIISWIKKHPMSEMMFHHRMPTSTGNVKNACHPFSTKDYFGETQYILIHNGVISNSRDLAKNHVEEHGIEYSSIQEDGRFNDSEALLWDVALYLEDKQTVLKSIGSCAFICLEKHKTDPSKNKLHYFHNSGNPLYKRDNKKAFMLSSIGGAGAIEVPINQHHIYSYETGETDSSYMWLPSTYYSYNSDYNTGTVDNHMPYSDDYPESQTSLFKEEEIEEISKHVKEFDEQEDQQLKLLSDNKSFSNKLKAKVREFLAYSEGNYNDCIFLLKSELQDLSKKPYSLGNWYEMQQLGGAIAILLADAFWDGENPETVHPVYNDTSDNNWDGSSIAGVKEPVAVLNSTYQKDSIKHIAQVLAQQAVNRKWNFSQKHTVPSAPDLITSIPVLP